MDTKDTEEQIIPEQALSTNKIQIPCGPVFMRVSGDFSFSVMLI